MNEPKRRVRPAAPKIDEAEDEAVGIGHNSGASETGEYDGVTVAAGQLRAFLERIERLEEEKRTIADDIKEVYAEAKGTGFDTKVMRAIVRLRRQDATERQEFESTLDLYKAALGMA